MLVDEAIRLAVANDARVLIVAELHVLRHSDRIEQLRLRGRFNIEDQRAWGISPI